MQISNCHADITKALTLAILVFEWWMGRQNFIAPKSTLSLVGMALALVFVSIFRLGVSSFKFVTRRKDNG
jgi:hypothetical protein